MGFGHREFKTASTTTPRVHFARPSIQASLPALIDSSQAVHTRTEALHIIYFQPSVRAQHDELVLLLLLLLLCVLSHMIRSHERRALGAPLLVSGSEPASTGSYVDIVRPRRSAATACAHRGCIGNPMHRSILVYRLLLLYQVLLSYIFT